MTEAPAGRWRSRAIIIAVFLLFFLPILVSWYLVFFTDYKHDAKSGTQHGILINPPRQLEDIALKDPLSGKITSLHGKWAMFMIVNADCDHGCTENLYRMRQIRLAMGKEMHRVQRASYMADINVSRKADKIFADYAGQLLLSSSDTDDGFLSTFIIDGEVYDHAIFLIDPFGFLMMVYPETTDPSGIIKDLKKLLRISKIE